MGKNMYGKAGADATYKVPVGTMVYRIPSQILRPPPTEEIRDGPPPKAVVSPADCELIADLSTGKSGDGFVPWRVGWQREHSLQKFYKPCSKAVHRG